MQQLLRAATCCLDKTPVCLTQDEKKFGKTPGLNDEGKARAANLYKVRVAGKFCPPLSLPQGELCGGTSSAVLHRCLAVDRALSGAQTSYLP